MKLDELIIMSGVEPVNASGGDIAVTGISYDSRKTKTGDLFFALPGSAANGKDFIPEAVRKGAAAVVSQDPAETGTPGIQVKDVKTAMALMAEAFYGFPSKKIALYGITGTNGKTTVTYMLESIAKAAGESCAVFGTVNYRFGKKVFTLPNTTAESADISRLLAEFVKSPHAASCFTEISSQGLDRKCAEALTFKAAVFTNLSREHLDWHGSMENYAAAKRKLFEKVSNANDGKGLAVINSDDPWSEKIISGLPLKKATFGINTRADYQGKIISTDNAGTVIEIKSPQEKVRVALRLPGEHNAMNALAAFALSREEGKSGDIIRKGLEQITDIKGRLSRIESEKGFTVYVDYAHTPDALEKVIQSLRPLTQKRIITVFGAGGNRDRGKRPEMGRAVSENSDFSWITSDNPRHEDPRAIALDIEVGMRKTEAAKFTDGNPPWKMELDREKAIEGAVAMAEKGDIILVAGKGHEEYQVLGSKKIAYSDIATVKKILKK